MPMRVQGPDLCQFVLKPDILSSQFTVLHGQQLYLTFISISVFPLSFFVDCVRLLEVRFLQYL